MQQLISMGLEKDIQQSKFRNEKQKALINLTFTHNWLNERLKRFLDQFDLTAQQFNILRILRGAGKPMSTLQIRERMLDKMSDTSRIVDRLILKKLVEKHTCERDKRLVDVYITQAGLDVLAAIDQYQDEIDNLISGLSTDEAKQLNFLLDKLREKASN